MTLDEVCQQAADQVLKALRGRRGIGHELGRIENDDPETWEEIRQSVAQVIRSTLRVEALQEALDAYGREQGGPDL